MKGRLSRREAVTALGAASAAISFGLWDSAAAAETENQTSGDYLLPDAARLRELYRRLTAMPRRRDFKTLPMVLTKPDQWDSEALDAIIAFDGPRQLFDTTRIAGGWINQIRNTMNAQVWSFKQANFLAAATPHGAAALALFNERAWRKYELAEQTDGAFKRNTFLGDPAFPQSEVSQPQNAKGLYSDAGNFIPTLQRRGVVFLGCHNAIWELASGLIARGVNPDRATVEELAADLTNSLIPGVVATPGNEATIGMLQHAGFVYSYV